MIIRVTSFIIPPNLSILILASFFYTIIRASPGVFELPEINSYARVRKNGNDGIINVTKTLIDGNSSGRSFRNFAISRSPIYVHGKNVKLRNGEAMDHPSTMDYSTLDSEAVKNLDEITNNGQRAQDRFHPPASFERAVAHGNDGKIKDSNFGDSTGSKGSKVNGFSVPSYATLPRDAYTTNYDYQPDAKPIDGSSSSSIDDEPGQHFPKIPDSYDHPEAYQVDSPNDGQKFSGFSSSSYVEKFPSKQFEQFSNNYDHQTFVDDSYPINHDDHDYHHDFEYEHPPDDHYHHHHHHHREHTTTTTTEEPEMNDQRLSKRPYSYYYIGKKLWYLPLYFSIYFIIYIAALVLKSITRHKINFPASLAAVAGDARHADGPSWLGLTKKVLDGIDAYNGIGRKIGSTKM